MAEQPAPEAWVLLETYADPFSAELHAGYLSGNGIPVRVAPLRDFPGQERGVELIVDAQCAERARYLLSLEVPGEEELARLATGSQEQGT
jgi:hypothetical protein